MKTMWKRALALVMAATVTISCFSMTVSAAPEEPIEFPFEDVYEDDWYYEAVYYNFVEELMSGKTATIFTPNAVLTRAEFASVLYSANDMPDVTYDAKFPDIAEEDWYAPAVIWASKEGIVNGYGSGLFGPTDAVAREQMAIMMYNYAAAKGYDTNQRADLSTFSDGADVSWYAEEAMQWAVGADVITGKDGGTRLDPYGATSRAECAAIMQKFMENFITVSITEKLESVASEMASRSGMSGRLVIPSLDVDVALFSVSSSDGAANQTITDASDSAAYMVWGNQMLIADHYYQGFVKMKGAVAGKTIAYINNGKTLEYFICTEKAAGQNITSTLLDNDGNDLYRRNAGGLCMYTCNTVIYNGQDITYSLWQPI